MVSQLTITSRTKASPVGFTQTYRNGVPTLAQPRPGARKPGTTLVVENLFYNVPHRLQAYQKRESDEYSRISQIVQFYAIRYPHCGFCLERRHHQKGTLVDVNTSQIPQVQALAEKKRNGVEISSGDLVTATKAVMAHVLEPNLEVHLSHLESSKPPNDNEFTYQAEIYFTLPTYSTKKSQFILFLNNRLIDLPVLKRSLEDVYSDFSKEHNAIMVVAVTVPGSQVDVNVHPSKRQVALMYQEELCSALACHLKGKLHEVGQSFASQSVAPLNPYVKKRKAVAALPPEAGEEEDTTRKRPVPPKKLPPSQLVRTSKAAQAGALEPFLVSTQPTSSTQESTDQESTTNTPQSNDGVQISHKPECGMASLDLAQPGAFAVRCTCASSDNATPEPTVLVKKPVSRPKRVIPTICSYSSIGSLRRRINKNLDQSLVKDLRDACFVGVVSHFRSLIQCGERLVMIHHQQLAEELFYQLALARFGGATVAKLGDGGAGGIDIETIIAQSLQLEDELGNLSGEGSAKDDLRTLEARTHMLESSETNQQMAQQATMCLVDHAAMLDEYFGIRIETEDDRVLLTGLPVLLDGHSPEPHGLAIFLLRLATRVEWTEERHCFQGVCRELGGYYALLPTTQDALETFVKHTLFPALSYLLLPPERFQKDGYFTTMTKLSTLYKVFERC
jgi:DNA mismatch repair protein MLH1